MSQDPSLGIQHCQYRAAECEHLAEQASNPETRNRYLVLAQCWHELAGSREFVEKLDKFLLNGGVTAENSGQNNGIQASTRSRTP